MSEFHDPELRQQLGRLSGPYPDDNVAFAAWQRRVGQARRRRAVAWTTGAALSLVLATVGFAAMQSPGRHTVVPGGRSSETSVSVTPSIATTEADDSTTIASTHPETSAPTSALDTTPSTEVELETSLPETGGDPAAGSQGDGSKNHGGSTSTPAAPSSAATQTFNSAGGSITVHLDGDKLTIEAINPAPGFDKHKSDDGDHKVGVVFTNGTRRIELTVTISNGVMKSSITEGADTHEDSVPNDTSGDHGDSDNG